MRYKNLIATTTAMAGLLIAGSAFAQDVQPESNTTDLEEVIVTGIRSSLRQSIEVKREANAVIDVITAEGIGKFPDRNVAEALSHIPGVSVDHQFGQGERVAIHGTDPALNRVLVDGHTIASADWGGNPSDRSSRSFNYSLLAPEIVARAEVYKSPEARIDEGSIGGTVIVHTRKPLDLDANSFAGSVGYAYNDRSEEGNLRASALYSWKNEPENLAILLGVTYDKERLTRAGVEYFGYSPGTSFNNSFTYTDNRDLNNDGNQDGRVTGGPNINGVAPTDASLALLRAARLPCCINFAYFDQTRERTGLSGAIQYKPTDTLEFLLTGLHIEGVYNNFSQSEYSVAVWNPSSLQSATVVDGLVTNASFPNNPTFQTAQLDTNYRKTTIQNDSLNLAANWTPDLWEIHADIGYTKATGGKDPEYLLSFITTSGFNYAFDGSSTVVNYLSDPANPATFTTRPNSSQTVQGRTFNGYQLGGVYTGLTTDEEVYGQVDFKRDVEWGPFTRVLFGAKYSDHTNSEESSGSSDYSNSPFTMAAIESVLTPEGLFDGLGASGNATRFRTVSADEVIRILAAETDFSFFEIDYGSSFEVDERVAAGYVQGNFESGGWRGNIGGRYVSTEDDAKYFLRVDNGPFQRTVVSTDYQKFLPALNVAYEITPDFIVRGSAAQVIARPRYGQLAGAFSRDDQQLTGGGGNPNLKPYESNNYEISAEWYPKAGTLLSAELFHRDIGSYIVNVTNNQVLFNPRTGQNATYSISTPLNATDAKVSGLLLSFQSDIKWGFGIQTNVSYAEADTTDYNIPFLSKYTVNVIPYYENGPFQARISYNYRSSYFTGIGRLNSKDSTDGYTQVDFSASYDVTERMSLTFNAQNLLDETYYSYSGTKDAPTAFYKNGRIAAISLGYKF